MYITKTINSVVDGRLQGPTDITIRHLLTDSRSIQFFAESAFFALVTARNNGHRYIEELYKKGVRCFVVSEAIPFNAPDACFIRVTDTLKALHQLTAHHRHEFALPVIAITGSNGKTIVKEWLYQLLKSHFTICRSPKSYNSQIGVPLSVWNLNAMHTLGIFEAGISTSNEMQALERIIKPTVGIFTGLGKAHQEGFSSIEEKLTEKFKLFGSCTALVVQGLKRSEIPVHMAMHEIILVSEHDDADVKIDDVSGTVFSSTITLSYKQKKYTLEIPFADKASVINASTCFGALIAMQLEPEHFLRSFKELQSVALRLEIKNGINNSVLINDFYNSDIDSFIIALNYLNQQSLNHKKTVIVSDIEQSGRSGDELYKELAALIRQYEIDLVIGVGKAISSHRALFAPNALFFNSTNDFVSEVPVMKQQFYNSTVLLKGARSFGFEKISQVLQQKSHDTV
ncbi:MAG: Mur ligase family protein, partial [Bacteroidia bacterium]